MTFLLNVNTRSGVASGNAGGHVHRSSEILYKIVFHHDVPYKAHACIPTHQMKEQ